MEGELERNIYTVFTETIYLFGVNYRNTKAPIAFASQQVLGKEVVLTSHNEFTERR